MGYDFANGLIKCPKCGHNVFVCYPQSQVVGAREHIWEYTCAKCGCCVAIKVKDWRENENE